MSYIHNVMVGLDQFVNTIFRGHPDETISARSGRAAQEGKVWGKIVQWPLNKIQPNHTTKAEVGDEKRAEVVEGLEKESLDERH